jgi:hypothetical protein
MQIAGRVMEQVNAYNPDPVFVDSTGIGYDASDAILLERKDDMRHCGLLPVGCKRRRKPYPAHAG